MPQLGRLLILVGVVIALVGVAFLVAGKLGLGRLPGDLVVERKNFTFHFLPRRGSRSASIVTSIVISILLTILLNLILRRR